MYHILIVEDEPRQIKALANIIRQLRPENTVSEAYDGLMALEFMEENSVDVVITDIRMPNMDGMQLIQALHQQNNLTKIILLSGYGEFEYAQKAIKLGIFDYVVKPVGKADIERLLSRVEQSLKQERNEKLEKENLARKLDDSFPVYMTSLLNKQINGSINDTELNELESAFTQKGSGVVIATEISKFEQYMVDHSNEVIEDRMQRIQNLMGEYTSTIGQSISFNMEGSRNKIITILNVQQGSVRHINETISCLDRLISTVNMEFNIDLTIGISKVSDNIFLEAKTYYEQAIVSLDRKFYYGLGRVIIYVEMSSEGEPYHLHQKDEELKDAIRKSEIETVSHIVNDYFDQFISLFTIQPEQIKEELIHVLLNQVRAVKHLVTEQLYNQWVTEIRLNSVQCEDYRELRHWAKKMLYQIIDLSHDREDKNSLIIQQCQKFIEVHYAEEITLDTLAQKYHFNSSYFSNLFKTYAGTGLSEFVIKVRVRKALELLLNTNCKMSEIAMKVGYKDAGYFIRVFKREMGMSPHKYRHVKGNV
ncbi:MAG: response regulator [Paenibacillaceae bacterium]